MPSSLGNHNLSPETLPVSNSLFSCSLLLIYLLSAASEMPSISRRPFVLSRVVAANFPLPCVFLLLLFFSCNSIFVQMNVDPLPGLPLERLSSQASSVPTLVAHACLAASISTAPLQSPPSTLLFPVSVESG